jgi:hypothetical protein
MIEQAERQLRALSRTFFADTGEMTQIAFSPYQVILYFEHMTIDIESNCEVQYPDGSRWVWEPERKSKVDGPGEAGHPSDMAGFAILLKSHILGFEVLPRAQLLLSFSNGCKLLLRANDSGYECFSISKEGRWGDIAV